MNLEQTENTASPIVICAQQRSGSTLLRNIIGAHADILAAPIGIGALCHAVFQAAYYLSSATALSLSEMERQAQAHQHTRQHITALIAPFLHAAAKSRWCDKSIGNLEYLDKVHAVFPGSRYICLYRHCLDVVHSNMEIGKRGYTQEVCPYIQRSPHNVVQALIESWADQTALILQFEQRCAASCLRVRYEDLVTRPERVLPALFAFVGVAHDAAILERTFSGHRSGVAEGDAGFHLSQRLYDDAVGKGRSLSLATVTPELQERMHALLAALGYDGAEAGLSADAPDIADLVELALPPLLNGSPLPRSVVALRVHGDGGGSWVIDAGSAPVQVRRGDAAADCVIGMSGTTLRQLLAGRKDLTTALEHGEIDATGSVELALGLGRALMHGGVFAGKA